MAGPITHPPHSAIGLRKARSVFRPPHDPAIRQESQRLVRAALQRAGFELDRLEELKRRSDADLRQALTKSRAAADERIPAMRAAVARSTENWLKANGVGEGLSPGPHVYPLSTADRITATPGFEFLSENVAPWANSAEVNLDRITNDSDEFDGNVTFTFSWQNRTGKDDLFRVSALLGVRAYCDVTCDGYFWPLDPTPPKSRLDAWAFLGITEIASDGQVFHPPYQSNQDQDIIHLEVDALWMEGNIAGGYLFKTYLLQYFDLPVPSNGRVQFDIGCEVYWLAANGGGQFHAAHHGLHLAGLGLFLLSAD